MFGAFIAPLIPTVYYGLKETLKYAYYPRQVTKKYKGNSGWMEVRFRHPSPGSTVMNEGHSAREHLRHHFKTPYPYSRYYVRNFWDPVKEGNNYTVVRIMPDLNDFTPEQQSRFLGFTKGDDAANERKKQKYVEFAKFHKSKNNPKDFSDETAKRIQSDMRVMFKGFNDQRKDVKELDSWEDMAEFPGASPYLYHPDAFMQDYGIFHFNSYENHLFIELEKNVDEMVDAMEEEGVPNREGDASKWQILDDSHRIDQQEEVVRNLKQRNAKKII